jgi:signal transduction histidine kinase
MVVLAFLIPLLIAVGHLARERALADAERQAAIVVAVLTVTTDPASVDEAVATTGVAWSRRVAVHGLSPAPVGTSYAKVDDVRLAAGQRQPVVANVAGGVAYLEPVDIGSGTAVVEVFVPEEELSRGVATAWWALAGVALFLIIVSVLASDRFAAKVVTSARQLGAAARALGDGDLTVRASVTGPRELAEAGLAFNTMADRVETLLASERELIADLSHRLRTPLTALRLEAERVGQGQVTDGRFRQAVDAMETEVDEIIRTARRPPAPVAAPEPDICDASEVVRERMGFWSVVAVDQSRPYRVSGVDLRAPVSVPRSDLVAALDALIANVFRYTPQGVAFDVGVSRRDGYVTIRVDDAGPGIDRPESALRRGSSGRGSTGLGLDIVRQAAVAGKGTVNVGRAAALGGASIVMVLADAERGPTPRPWLGFVGRLSREPGDPRPLRWRRKARRARPGDGHSTERNSSLGLH